MENPVLVEVLRGDRLESRHRGAFAVIDADGALVASAGDVARPVFPRSAVKAIQALPLIESGAADRYGLGEEEIALACASHAGMPVHAETASGMLAKAGLQPEALECGAHWPMSERAARALAAHGERPSALHNNCSGKHAGFLCVACAAGMTPAGYVKAAHPLQEEVRGALEALTGAAHGPDNRGTDGCSIPTYAVPLSALARGFARFASGTALPPQRAAAAARIAEAIAAAPVMVAGEGRFDTELMTVLGRRALVKTGAEGVYCAALPELGLGIALKIDDGATRAAELAMAVLVEQLLPLDARDEQRLEPLLRPVLRNWNGIHVGALVPTHALAAKA